MSGNTFGKLFAVTNFGESHGPAIGCVIDGCPPGMALSRSRHPARPRPAPPRHLRHVTQRNEADTVEILSGVYEGMTTGTPICLLIRNTDQRSKDYRQPARHLPPRPRRLHLLAQVRPARPARRRPRLGAPDRADGRRRRGGEEVAARAARHRLSRLHDGSSARSRSRSRAGSTCPNNPFFAPTRRSSRGSRPTWTRCARPATRAARASASTATNVPVGLGEPLFDKLDADIAYAMMGINAVKGVEIGAGFAASRSAAPSTATS